MADYTKYTKQEMQAYASSKNIKENQIVIGTGWSLVNRCILAKRVVLPELPSDRESMPSYGLFSD